MGPPGKVEDERMNSELYNVPRWKAVLFSAILALLPIILILVNQAIMSLLGCYVRVETDVEGCQGLSYQIGTLAFSILLMSALIAPIYLIVSVPLWISFLLKYQQRLKAKKDEGTDRSMEVSDMTLRPRAVAILFNAQHQVLLMLRRKNGKAYATLPGGGIEAGETPAEACAREVLEEVNLVVEVGPEVLVLENLNNLEHYFQVRYLSGEMRLGDGPEGTIRQSEQNHYEPAWVNLTDLESVNLVPEQARELVRGVNPSGSFADRST